MLQLLQSNSEIATCNIFVFLSEKLWHLMPMLLVIIINQTIETLK